MEDYARFGLVSYIAKRLGEARQYFGKVVVQKIFYFLTCHSRLPLPYKFYFYHYGPYSEELKYDLDMMQLFGIISIRDDPQHMGYQIVRLDSGLTQECEAEAKSFIAKHLDKIERVITAFGSEDPGDLEVSATVHYVFESTKEHCPEAAEHKRIVLDKVRELKPKFSHETIEKSFDFLNQQGFLANQN